VALTVRSRIFWLLLVMLGIAAGGVYGWREIGPRVVNDERYRLLPEGVLVNAPPAWIRTDITSEVLRDASIDGNPPSILDGELAQRMARAFELHPWVARVVEVRKEGNAQ